MKLNGKNSVMHVIRTANMCDLERFINELDNVVDIYFESVYDHKEQKLMHIAMVFIDKSEEGK